jgi:hypothetical protein
MGPARAFRSIWHVVSCLLVSGWTALAAPNVAQLPSDVRDAIRERYLSADGDTRYLDGAVDLDADGQTEVIVHVASLAACGTGGCPTLVFTHLASGYRLHSVITVSNPPIRVSSSISKGWRNLIVRAGGGDAPAQDVELSFDGKTYPGNPTVSGRGVKIVKDGGGHVVINAVRSFEQMKPFPTAVP